LLLFASTPASSICQQRFACQLAGRNDESALGFRVGDVNDAQIPPAPRLTNGDARTISTRSIFARRQQYSFGFILRHAVPTQVREAGIRVTVEPQFHLCATESSPSGVSRIIAH
jgi:hypothetical protein